VAAAAIFWAEDYLRQIQVDPIAAARRVGHYILPSRSSAAGPDDGILIDPIEK
jgi:hypothetical protein